MPVTLPDPEPLDFRLLNAAADPITQKTPLSQAVGALTDIDPLVKQKRWEIQGPATVGWIMREHLECGMSPRQRHHWWRSTLRLDASSPGCEEHLFLCELLEVATLSDRLNVAGLQYAELISRRLQLWEEYYSEQLRMSEGGQSSMELDERRIFLGQRRTSGLALLNPELMEYVGDKLTIEANVLKQRRKGREEKRLAAGERAPLALGPPGALPAGGAGGEEDGVKPPRRRPTKNKDKAASGGGQ
jgi:hypothetical protein